MAGSAAARAAALGADLMLRGGFGGTGTIEILDVGASNLADRTLQPVAQVDPAGGLVAMSAARVLATVDDPAVVRLAWLRGVLGCSAELIGLAQRMLDITVGYVRDRHQFGVPIGSFQAVKHHLADAALAVEFAAPVVASAAARLAAGHDQAAAEVSAAKVLAGEAALTVARRAIQCHGGMGYTTEYDLHFYVKRSWAAAASWGSADWHRATLGDALGLPPPVSTPRD